jgi:AhpD family alkylhydroperoxidase
MNSTPEGLKGVYQGIGQIVGTVWSSGIPPATLHLVHLRVSQINGCSWCTDSAGKEAARAGETAERLMAVAAWRHAPYFTDAERAALALAEAATRMADREDPVPDAIWNAARQHFDERRMAALLVWIGTANLFNRVNVPTQIPAGTHMPWEQAA